MNQTRWQQIETLYHAALEREPVNRAAFLRQECGGDEDLRTEIESLISSHEQADNFLAKPDFELGLKLLTKPHHVLQSGQTFSHYKILNFLGSGGMGEVYLAQDARLKRRVALKLLPRTVTKDQDRVRRFRQEARAASQIVHANIAQVYEAGEIDDNHFIAMEFVDGVTLREHLAKNPISSEEILTIAEQIAAALKAAHEVGVIHRDLKPENIMLRRDGAVKVLDFSLAKLTRRFSSFNSPAETKQMTLNTEPGIVLGTATYMSPEQARGQKVDHRTDIWSFGVLLYEMLTGEPPFRGATAMDTIAAILTAEFSMPDSLENSDKLRHVVGKSLRKEPAERYQSAEEILLDLKNPQLGLKIAAKNPHSDKSATTDDKIARHTENFFAAQSTPDDFKAEEKTSIASNRRSLRLYFIAAVCLLLLAGGLGFTIQQWRGENLTQNSSAQNNIKSIAVLPFKTINIEAEENLAIGMADALINRLGSLGQFTVRPTGAVKKFARQDIDPIAAGQELKVDAVLDGNIQRDGDKLRVTVQMIDVRNGKMLWTNSFDENVSGIFKMQENISARVAQSLSSKLPGNEPSSSKYQENTEAYRAYLKGQFHADREIEEEMVKAAKYYRQTIEIDPTFAPAYVGLANYYADGFGEAKVMTYAERMEKSRELSLKALELDESLAAAHVSLASILMHYDWNWTEAEKEYRRTIELNPNFARAYHGFAYFLIFNGRFDEAIAAVKRAEEIDPISQRATRDIGIMYFFARRYDEAQAAFEKAYELDREELSLRVSIGAIYQSQKKYEEAIAEYQAAIRLNPDYLDNYSALGQTYGLAGQKEKALKTLAEMQRRAAGRKIWTYFMIKIYAGLGDKDKAFYWLEKGMEDRSIGIRLKVDPHFDSLRDDPRFAELIRRVGFPE